MERTLVFILSLNVALYTSHLYLYFYKVGQTGIKPLYWYVLTLGFTGAVLLSTRILRDRPLPTPLLLWVMFFFAYLALSWLHSSQSEAALQTLVSGIEIGLLFLAFVILFQLRGGVAAARRVLLLVGLAGASINFIDFIEPAWTELPGRAAGLYANPNTSAAVLTFCMVAGVQILPARLRPAYCLLIGAAVVITFSRGGWLLWATGLFGLVALGVVRTSRLTGVAITAGAGLLMSVLLSGAGYALFSWMGAEQFLSTSALERLQNPLTGASTGDRLALISHAAEVFYDNPLFGAGLASTQEWQAAQRPHDTYLYLAAEGGLLGVSLFLALLGVLWRLTRGQDRLTVVLFAIFSLFSHNALEKPELFLFLALAVSSSMPLHSRAVARPPSREQQGLGKGGYGGRWAAGGEQ